MDLFQRIVEAFKVKKGSQKLLIDEKLPSSFHKANFQEVYQFLNDVKTVNKTRKDRMEDVDRMAFDSVIASAMELITDDVCQEDPITEKCVWVNSEDPNTVDVIMDFLDTIDIEQMLAYMTYNIVRYGEIYYKTYFSEFADNKMPEEYKNMRGYMFEPVVKDYNIADIHKYGSPIGFAKIDEESGTSVLYPVNDYIHIYNNRLNKFDKITLDFTSGGEKVSEEFNMVYGSPLFESAMQAWRMVDLIEALLIYVRFGRSGFYRLVKVDVGGVPTSEATNILTNLKQVFSQQDNINIVEQTYSGARKPIPHGENLIVPISQGKGDITVEQVGGESDIKEVVDLEYWRNKLFAALKMPKAYLGFEETMPGSLGNTTLTRQDIRYARSVKAVKKVVKNGIQQIIDSHLRAIGKEYLVGQYEVCMTKIMSAETSDIEESMSTNINLAESLRSLLQDARIIDQDELIKFIINEILKLGDKAQDLFLTEEEMEEQLQEEQEYGEDDFGSSFDDFSSPDFGSNDFGRDNFSDMASSDFGSNDFGGGTEAPSDFGSNDFATDITSPETTV